MPDKIKLGKYGKGKTFTVPSIADLPRITKNESLLFFGKDEKLKDKKYHLVLGIGRVVSVEHGENLDLVRMNFGYHKREILVYDNHARRQIYTLKRGHLAWFYGISKTILVDGKSKKIFLARGFQAWYVPKMLDIKHYDLDTMTQMEKENEQTNQTLVNFIDDLLKGNIEDE